LKEGRKGQNLRGENSNPNELSHYEISKANSSPKGVSMGSKTSHAY
jgi:hypothetical protein